MLAITLFLFTLGLCAGSFVNALVWRLKKKKDWVKSRSQCINCGHTLSAGDLVPVLSWLFLRGRCRYCQKPISAQYPIVELAGGVVFALSYLLWPQTLDASGQWILFTSWILTSVGLLALLVYDYKWMLLPNGILYPTALVAIAGRLIYTTWFEPDISASMVRWVLSVAIASGIFLLIYLVSNGKWIGYGDVRLGIITGTVLASPSKSFLMIFAASLLGVLYVLPALATGRQKLASKVPFGPFLIVATFIVLLFGQQIIDWYTGLLT